MGPLLEFLGILQNGLRFQELCEETANEINEDAGLAIPFAVDVTQPDQMLEVAQRIQKHPSLGDPYLVICNAGVLYPGSMVDQSEDQIRRTINVNLLGYFWVSA